MTETTNGDLHLEIQLLAASTVEPAANTANVTFIFMVLGLSAILAASSDVRKWPTVTFPGSVAIILPLAAMRCTPVISRTDDCLQSVS